MHSLLEKATSNSGTLVNSSCGDVTEQNERLMVKFHGDHKSLLQTLVTRIFYFLSADNLGKAGRVCHEWRQISLNPDLWQGHCIQDRVNCGPGIEALLEKCNGDKGLWWKWIYTQHMVTCRNWQRGIYVKSHMPVTDVLDAITWQEFFYELS